MPHQTPPRTTLDDVRRDVGDRRGMLAELGQLRAALPGYDVIINSHGPAYRFEAVRRPGAPATAPWCVVSTDPADLWRELVGCTRPHANTSTDAAP